MANDSNSGTYYVYISCGVPSDVGANINSNSVGFYIRKEPNEYILWGQSTKYNHVQTNALTTIPYFYQCGVSSNPAQDLESNAGTYYYYSSAFNCVSFCAGTIDTGNFPNWPIYPTFSEYSVEISSWSPTGTPTAVMSLSTQMGPIYFHHFSGTLAPNGKIYYPPGYDCKGWSVLNTTNNTVISAQFGIPESTYDPGTVTAWVASGLAADGKIYAIPYDASGVLVLNYATETCAVSTYNIGYGGTEKWTSSIYMPNGKIYGVPKTASNIFVLDTITQTASLCTFGLPVGAGGLGGTRNWSKGVIGANQKIFGVPYLLPKVLVIDTIATSAAITDLGFAGMAALGSYQGGVLAPNGKIYCAPYNATSVLVIDTLALSATSNSYGLTLTEGNKYSDAVLGPDGRIYMIPAAASKMLIINPSTETAAFSTFGVISGTSSKWGCGVVAPNGHIYCSPWGVPQFLDITVPGTGTSDVDFNDVVLSPFMNNG